MLRGLGVGICERGTAEASQGRDQVWEAGKVDMFLVYL